ncbi:hypothetical protein, conserved [Trypanosoma brucei brucei TREU927]|uniref:Kri1-like C-terminal domain-containing protein n=1 Tax=Trypanosoma brucei brucei (strain 927/4 GUTat10.1) TaxID=185431 RepID=Q57W29_TRYB2|nr:hypothetical protein, conserved [Trypanosoma brucei brucei TREU927]AAX70190.1 hypothetical protein, conserved [Trypanosoma brucei]AAZ11199.1 hypothetical protein, conserved [Trypanosoma brucei brucei TREU927]
MPKKDLFSSSSSDDSDADDLGQQMAVAAAVEKRRNPHAYDPTSGKRKGKSLEHSTTSVAAVQPLDSSDDDNEAGHDKVEAVNDVGPIDPALKSSTTESTGKPKGKKSKKKKGDVDGANISGDDDDDDDGGIRINKQYAAKYEEVKRRKELQQLTQKYSNRLRGNNGLGDLESDEEDEEDDGAVLLTESKELAFAKTFLAIRQAGLAKKRSGKQAKGSDRNENTKTDSSVSDADAENKILLNTEQRFFPPPEEQVRENTEVFAKAVATKREKRNKFTLADEYRRGVVMSAEKGGANEKDDGEDVGKDESTWGSRRIQPQSEKERKLRESFLQSVAESGESFSVKPAFTPPADQQQSNEESEAKRLLAGAFSIRAPNRDGATTDGDDASANHDADEEFLRDFFVEELWKPENNRKVGKNGSKASRRSSVTAEDGPEPADGGESGGNSASDYEDYEEGNNYAALAELAQAEEDERFFAEAEVWERKFQERAYRHQEENADHVQSFPRAVGSNAEGLLRKTAQSSRKEAHLRRLTRMRELREQQVAELRRLKTLKRQEIEEQRALIASIAGISREKRQNHRDVKVSGGKPSDDEDAAVRRLMSLWSEKDLDEDFDPSKFDSKMSKIFDDNYYDEKNVDEEEIAFFEDEEDINGVGEPEGQGEENEVYKQQLEDGESVEESLLGGGGVAGKGVELAADDAMELLYPTVTMPELEETPATNSREQIERLLRQQKKQPGATDPDEVLEQLQTTLKQKEKEYWQLHHESTLDGGSLKTRFKYRRVVPENFTLSVEEILAQDDRQLNMLVPMNCYAAYLSAEENRRDRIRADKRRRRGFREIDSSRSSRRYGDVSKTSLVDPNMKEEEGEKWAENVRKSLRRLRQGMGLDHEDSLEDENNPGDNMTRSGKRGKSNRGGDSDNRGLNGSTLGYQQKDLRHQKGEGQRGNIGVRSDREGEIREFPRHPGGSRKRQLDDADERDFGGSGGAVEGRRRGVASKPRHE